MKAVLLNNFGDADAFRLTDVPMPTPGAGEVRIRMVGAAVNPVDVKARRGVLKDFVHLAFPAQLGGDISGVVDSVGPGVTRFSQGDRVAGMVNPFANGAYAEYVVAHQMALVPVPPEMNLLDAAALPTGVLTGIQLIDVGIRPRGGERVLVTGAAGSTGRAAVLALIEAGATPVAGVRKSSRGAVADLNVEILELDDQTSIDASSPFDAIADTVGGELLGQLFSHLKADGRVASIAVPVPVPPEDAPQQFTAVVVRFDYERLVKFMAGVVQGKFTVPIAYRVPLRDVKDAHRIMEKGGTNGKILLYAGVLE